MLPCVVAALTRSRGFPSLVSPGYMHTHVYSVRDCILRELASYIYALHVYRVGGSIGALRGIYV